MRMTIVALYMLSVTIGIAGVSDGPESTFAAQLHITPSSSIMDVSCASSAACMAVGWYAGRTTPPSSCPPNFPTADCSTFPLAEWWNGHVWTITPTPKWISVGGQNDLSSVSCPTASFCVALGGDQPGVIWWNGKTWSLFKTPLPPPYGALTDVSCASPRFCLAVGDGGSSNEFRPLTELWNGRAWRLVGSRQAFQVGDDLGAVTCIRQACIGVKSHFKRSGILDSWMTDRWVAIGGPRLSRGEQYDLTGTACLSASTCWAVGSMVSADELHYSALTLEDHHGTLSMPPASEEGRPRRATWKGYDLQAVSCADLEFCMAVGEHAPRIDDVLSVSDEWGGARWHFVPSATEPAGIGDDLTAVTCSEPSFCLAGGERWNEAVGVLTAALIEAWNGSAWRIVKLPLPLVH